MFKRTPFIKSPNNQQYDWSVGKKKNMKQNKRKSTCSRSCRLTLDTLNPLLPLGSTQSNKWVSHAKQPKTLKKTRRETADLCNPSEESLWGQWECSTASRTLDGAKSQTGTTSSEKCQGKTCNCFQHTECQIAIVKKCKRINSRKLFWKADLIISGFLFIV